MTKQYDLPDGQLISIDYERIKCPEALFQPSLIGKQGKGIHQLIIESVSKCSSDVQSELYGNIVLAGGSTLFEGLESRLDQELTKVGAKFKINASPARKDSA